MGLNGLPEYPPYNERRRAQPRLHRYIHTLRSVTGHRGLRLGRHERRAHPPFDHRHGRPVVPGVRPNAPAAVRGQRGPRARRRRGGVIPHRSLEWTAHVAEPAANRRWRALPSHHESQRALADRRQPRAGERGSPAHRCRWAAGANVRSTPAQWFWSRTHPGRPARALCHVRSHGRARACNDKGIDQVVIYRLRDGRLEPAEPPFGQLHAGAAPRHLSFHPNGRYAYVNGEADMTITAFAYDRGALRELQVLPTMPENANRDGCSTAQILVEPSGSFVYVSNRGHDSIAQFAIDKNTGLLTSLGNVPTQGRTPRNFTIDPSGKRLYAANQESDTIVQFAIGGDGTLAPTGNVTEVGAPVCIVFR